MKYPDLLKEVEKINMQPNTVYELTKFEKVKPEPAISCPKCGAKAHSFERFQQCQMCGNMFEVKP